MKHLIHLVIPQKSEAIFWVVIGFSLLVAQNVGRLIDWLSNSSGIRAVAFEGNYWSGLDNFVHPRFIDFIIWIIVGLIVYLLLSIFIAIAKTINEDFGIIHYYNNPQSKQHAIIAVCTKYAIRLLGLACIVLWVTLLINVINPYLVDVFYDSIFFIASKYYALFILIFSITIYSIYLYLSAIFVRLIFLKIRLLSSQEEPSD